jgi:4-oxalocrotonate tautomerase
MPEVIVHAAAGRSPEQKKNLMLAITDAVVKEFGVPKESVTVTIAEAPKELKMKAGVLFSER